MTASGPFAMGPALAGTSARRAAPRAAFTPIVPLGLGGTSALGAGLTRSAAPALKKEKAREDSTVKTEDDDDIEVYSDPDEGVEIVDMENVRTMDWMAPESLRREREKRKTKKVEKVKREDVDVKLDLNKGKGVCYHSARLYVLKAHFRWLYNCRQGKCDGGRRWNSLNRGC